METTASAPAAAPSAPVEGALESAEGVATTPPTPEAVQAQKKKYKLKVDGEDVEEEIDFNDDEGMTKRLQLARGAKKRMAEAQEEKKKAFEIIKAFEQDPESMLRRLGPKGREIAEKYLLAQIQEDMLTPEQKMVRDLKQENETYKQKEAREKQEREQSISQKKEYEYAQSFQKTIITALDQSGLPKTPELVKRMASVMSKNLQLGLELTPEDLVAEVKGDITNLLKSIIGDSDGEKLIAMFGNDVANKIRKSDLKKLQERQGQVFQSGKKPSSGGGSAPQPKGYETPDEWKARIARNLKE